MTNMDGKKIGVWLDEAKRKTILWARARIVATSESINSAEMGLDEMLDSIPRKWLIAIAFIILGSAVLVGINVNNLPQSGWKSAPNLIFLGFVLFFGVAGIIPKTNSRFWSIFGTIIGGLMWIFSLLIS